jgi:hypothetical protein
MGVAYNTRIVTDGLVACYDLANTKRSYSPNIHPSATNIYDWYVGIRGNAQANQSTIAKDTIESPVGNTPLRMDITGNDPHIYSYGGLQWNLGEASVGETWTVSVYAKASCKYKLPDFYLWCSILVVVMLRHQQEQSL